MKKDKLIEFFFVAVVFLTALQALAVETKSLPTTFIAKIGTFKKYSYEVKLTGSVLSYSKYGRGEKTEIKITPTPEQWVAFQRELDRIRVWQWRSKYDAPLVLDGTGWSLLISYSDRSIRTSGSNNYPNGSGKSSERPTKAFEEYLAAVRKLIGDREFDK